MMTDIGKCFALMLLLACGSAMAQQPELSNASLKAPAAMDTIRDTTTLANLQTEREALKKEGWDIIGIEKHTGFVVIIGVRPIKSKKNDGFRDDTVVYSAQEVNRRGDTFIYKTFFLHGDPIKDTIIYRKYSRRE